MKTRAKFPFSVLRRYLRSLPRRFGIERDRGGLPLGEAALEETVSRGIEAIARELAAGLENVLIDPRRKDPAITGPARSG